jgi:hypothetical protein
MTHPPIINEATPILVFTPWNPSQPARLVEKKRAACVTQENLNDRAGLVSYDFTMTKLTGLALMAAAAFAITPALAGDKDNDHACCAKDAKMDSAAFANLNLSAEQKTKMNALVEKCNKSGCTKESMEAFMKSAGTILSKDQMAAFKAECSKRYDKKDEKA